VGIVLGDNRYGKAETRLLRVTRRGDVHEIRDLNVTTSLSGDFEDVHVRGDNRGVLPTDSHRNAVNALAGGAPVGAIEDFALRLARHLVAASPAARRALVQIDEHPWERIPAGGQPHPHAFARTGQERRLACAAAERGPGREWAAAGLSDLVVLKTTGSEFRDFLHDRYTTLEETDDRVMATAVTARWRFSTLDVDWAASHAAARCALLDAFATRHSRSLQQTMYDMGRAVLEARPEVDVVRLSLPNRHHLAVDLTPFGIANAGEVFHPTDRPYGLIEGTVRRDGAPDAPSLDRW
jgi:urate oxidase